MNRRDDVRVRHRSMTLPALHDQIITSCREQQLTFEYLYRKLQEADPCAAAWLRDETEYLAPANPAEKEKYAVLALKMHYMLTLAARQH